jgi:hypothetical protein
MILNALYYALSTIAQCAAALAAGGRAGPVVPSETQRLRNASKQ